MYIRTHNTMCTSARRRRGPAWPSSSGAEGLRPPPRRAPAPAPEPPRARASLLLFRLKCLDFQGSYFK